MPCAECVVDTAAETLLQSADAVCGKVGFCKREARGVYWRTRPERRATQGEEIDHNVPPHI